MGSDRDSLDHDFEDISIAAKVGLCVFEAIDCVYADEGIVLSASVVVDIVFFIEVALGYNVYSMRFCLLVVVPVAVNLDPVAAGRNVLPLFVKVLEDLLGLGLCPSHFTN